MCATDYSGQKILEIDSLNQRDLQKMNKYMTHLIMNSTVICHIFNEAYLLPFWLDHHKTVFDHGVIIDYRSTDGSLDIVRSICPNWTIVTSRNPCFDAAATDQEVMDIENGLSGIKMALNVTEFLVLDPGTLMRDLITRSNECLAVEALVPVTASPNSHVKNLHDLMTGFDRVSEHYRMGYRYLHSWPNGSYEVGRHFTAHDCYETKRDPQSGPYLLWFGFFPWNAQIIQRKLQIRAQIPQSDVDDRLAICKQHMFDHERLLKEQADLVQTSVDVHDKWPGLSDAIKNLVSH